MLYESPPKSTDPRVQAPNACGAWCLLLAALGLGVNEIPKDSKVFVKEQGEKLSNSAASEQTIYRVSKGSEIPLRSLASKNSDFGEYSYPDHIIMAIAGLDLDYEYDSSKTGLLRKNPEANSLLGALDRAVAGVESAFNVKSSRAPSKGVYALELLILSGTNFVEGLHWLLRTPDGTYFDPATGKETHPSSVYQERGWWLSGLSIKVWKEE